MTTSHTTTPSSTETAHASIDRRAFLRMLGATSSALLAEGCDSGDGEEPELAASQFRAINPPVEVAIDVQRAKSTQTIIETQEHMSIDNDLAIYLGLGDQCRVKAPNGEFALYTVGDVRGEPGNNRCRMGLSARCRLGLTSTFPATLLTSVVAPDGTSDQDAAALGEFVERLVDDGASTSICVLAPHGGFIERYTDEQAEHVQTRLAAKDASSWICKGYKPGGGAYNRWHITSTELSPNSFPGLGQIANRGFAYALSFHGMSHDIVLVGGGAPFALRQQIRDAIEAATLGSITVTVAADGDIYPGDSPNNVVNWLTAGGTGGVQIEQSMAAREQWGLAIADAVADVFEGLL